jgi:hypothetical protein
MAIAGLTVGGGNITGISGTDARDDHEHAIPRGTPVALPVGGSNVAGASGDFADASHQHELPPFGDASGELCEGDDPRLIDPANYVTNWDPAADAVLNGLSSMTEWDDGGYITVTDRAAEGAVELEGIGNNTIRMGGLYTAIPASEFQFSALVTVSYVAGGVVDIGLMVGNVGVGNVGYVVLRSGPSLAAPRTHTGFTTSYTSVGTSTSSPNGSAFLRIRVNGTTVEYDCSPDGRSWRCQGQSTRVPVHYGICFRNDQNGVPAYGRVQTFDLQSGAGTSLFTAYRPGRLVRNPLA